MYGNSAIFETHFEISLISIFELDLIESVQWFLSWSNAVTAQFLSNQYHNHC